MIGFEVFGVQVAFFAVVLSVLPVAVPLVVTFFDTIGEVLTTLLQNGSATSFSSLENATLARSIYGRVA